MNTKLYSLFVFIYLIVVYCATVQGNKNGKNDVHEPNGINKKSNKKDNKHVQKTDGIEDYENFDKNCEPNKESMNSVKEEDIESEAIRASKKKEAYIVGISSLATVLTLSMLRGCALAVVVNSNSCKI
ncbi:uncharacterized protein PY17X_0115800 [Plasmodium yoelii]|uniref:Uncharacterized protein n=2 Tax=Plasmodium yoelii TaxID=5861 RepID=A0AAE9WIQ7_PLAYO|nr:uncharacterized protein PY17X_0115800 [Plasmodium yoelii]WBY54588.1 hypothetical protein Py17XNL_000104812 [Plasmodium yoelii yoelii]CDU15987.1 hypothetical protein PYYM_0115200 [Plasmodium yoelii]VTZ71582.1 hypothetical protein PY17X_0115800 [Plasmodium yoelii]|eukprot:XP_728238.2 uncharacterized protein PY17X_0115800 [Plasmodium yoelii]